MISMQRYVLEYLLIFVLLLACSCDRYPQVVLTRKIFPAASGAGNAAEKNKFDEILKRYRLPEADPKSYYARSPKLSRVSYTRYFADTNSCLPVAEINNKGVEYALKGMYAEAEILFNEAVREDGKFSSAYNNLGVIHELGNSREAAFAMYSKACLLDPENKYFRWNFLYFCDIKTDSVLK